VRKSFLSRPGTFLLTSIAGVVLVCAGCSNPSATTHPRSTAPTASTTGGTAAPSRRLGAIAFFNAQNGYALFEAQSKSGCQDLVGSTSDGGASFGPLALAASWNCVSNSPVRSLAFDDQGDGFLYGPDLYMSHDHGKNWTVSTQSGNVLAVEALGLSIWMVTSGCPASTSTSSVSCPLELLESSDGGRTWVSTPVPAGAVLNSRLESEAALGQTWLVRISQSSAYLVSNPATNEQGLPDDVPIWYTDDGGTSWTSRAFSCGMNAQSAVLGAAPDGTLLGVCASEPGAGSQGKSVARSTDGGMTWTTESVCPIASSPSVPVCAGAVLTNGYLGGLDVVSAHQAYLVGPRANLLVTKDGGASWQPVDPPTAGTAGGTSQVIFFNALDGVVLGDNDNNNEIPTIWRTSDGGQQWTPVVSTTG
jgi:photosystem II stability/assembly factor-like uncharacterized protein